MPGGLSGGTVFRCIERKHFVGLSDPAIAAPSFALKCWPAGTSIRRVTQIHRVVSELANRNPIVPQYRRALNGQTLVADQDNRLWELATWMKGQPIVPEADSTLIQQGARAIGLVHRTLRELETWPSPSGTLSPSAAVAERLDRVGAVSVRLGACLASNLAGSVPQELCWRVSDACHVLRLHWERKFQQIGAELGEFRGVDLPQHWILRDVHQEHLLFDAGQVTGIIDFDAMRVDSPLVDFARWLGSFQCFWQAPAQIAEQTLAECSPGTPFPALPATSSKLLVAIARASLWISLANWVVWLIDESRQFPDLDRVQRRLGRLTDYASRDAEH
ncbi:phosphotransferase [Roseiconus lacunae]|uniref:Aminoglycoside phosphotransferase family protein n=1 Tax=Roseiconus lacunae TaxID=2605694 RepID=A0ABT7PCZ9_9BACT|nr:aminoglycoside phosphotransferase family protein [Roseiconus lacunae]MDM4014149.1 aminoglycoside phosphotransferase family protein [Roseiconus lacunae]